MLIYIFQLAVEFLHWDGTVTALIGRPFRFYGTQYEHQMRLSQGRSIFRIDVRCSTHQSGESCIFESEESLKQMGTPEEASE